MRLPSSITPAIVCHWILSGISLTCLAGTFSLLHAEIAIPPLLEGPEFSLSLQTGLSEIRPGTASSTMGVNGPLLGPTLVMNEGEFVDVQIQNNLGTATTIHWHGMHVSAANDGGPHSVIQPDETWNPQFAVLDKAGTYWYHPHLHENTNLHASLGIAGFVIVRDAEEAALELPRTYGVDDFPLAIQTRDIDSAGQIIVPSNSDSVLTVNGSVNAELSVPAQVVRLRLLNGSSMRSFNLGFSDNLAFHMIASDGGLLAEPVELTRLLLSPGERAEVLFDFSAIAMPEVSLNSYASELPSGVYGATTPGMMPQMVLNGYNPNPLNGSDFEVLRFLIQETGPDPVTSIPEALVPATPYLESEADTTRQLTFTPQSPGPGALNGSFLINGTAFDMEQINMDIPLGNTEIWTLTNSSPISHPFHIHNVQFQVLDLNGSPPPPELQGRKDVVLVRPMSTVRFITRFLDHADDEVPYMYHCHMLIHEDDGMMGQFVVVDPQTEAGPATAPRAFDLLPAHPNPFNPSTVIPAVLERAEDVRIQVLDLRGALVETLYEGRMEAGRHDLRWHADNRPSGVYIIRMKGRTETRHRKILLLK